MFFESVFFREEFLLSKDEFVEGKDLLLLYCYICYIEDLERVLNKEI